MFSNSQPHFLESLVQEKKLAKYSITSNIFPPHLSLLHREHRLHIPAHPQRVVEFLQSATGGPLHLRHGVLADHDARGHQEPRAGDLSPRDNILLPPLPSQRHCHDGLYLHDHSHRI